MNTKEQNQELGRKINGTNAAVPLYFLRSVSRILGHVLQFVTKHWIWAFIFCTSCSDVSIILGNTNI